MKNTRTKKTKKDEKKEPELYPTEKVLVKLFTELDMEKKLLIGTFAEMLHVGGYVNDWPLSDILWQVHRELDEPGPLKAEKSPKLNWLKGVFDTVMLINERS